MPAAPSFPPVIAGGRIFQPSLPGQLSAHDLKDGHELWRETITLEQPLAVGDERVFVVSGEAVHALQAADRTVAWRTPTGTLTAPLLARSGWVIAASATRTMALRESDGAIVWERESPPERASGTIDGDVLYLPLANGRLQALDLQTGATRWERAIGGSPTEPLVLGDRLYVGATDKYFYCLKTSTGEIDWKIRVGAALHGHPGTDGHRVFFVALDNLVRAVSRGSGSQRWQQGVPFRPFTGPTVAGPSILIAGPTNDVRMLSATDGKDAGRIAFPEPLVIAPAIARSGEEIVAVGVTGGLSESWKMWLVSPVPKASPTAPLAR